MRFDEEDTMKRVGKFLLVLCMLLLGLQWNMVIPQAAARAVKIELKAADIKKQGFDTVMQNALNEAKAKATAKKPYEIKVPGGTYQLDHTMLVYSNTKLILKGVTLRAAKDKNVFHVGSLDTDSSGAKGYCYKNISIEGGVLDGRNHSGTVVKVGHAENFQMTGVTLCNVKNAHLMETGGVKGLTVTDCTFKNQVSTSKDITYYEAIQLDILYPWHLVAYRAETLNTTDVRIDHCKFINTPRGVGSHTAILNQPMKNITISNCTFEKMGSAAIQGLNWKNVTITDNVIKEAPRGIACYLTASNGNGTYLPSVLSKTGKTKTKLPDRYKAPDKNMGLLIKGNTITTNAKKDPYAFYERVAIYVGGADIEQKFTNKRDQSGSLPFGDYYYSGVKIQDNTIRTTGHGIRFVDTKNAEVSGNVIKGSKTKDSTNYYGIQIMTNSKDVDIRDNQIQNAVTNGIYVNKDSEVKAITGNTITGSGKYGIGIESATVASISDNTIKDTALRGIFIFKHATVKEIGNNEIHTVSDADGRGIHVCEASAVGRVAGNTITNPGVFGIVVTSASSVDTVEGNEVTGATKAGIRAASDSTIKSGY